jgi:hypothetical protein
MKFEFLKAAIISLVLSVSGFANAGLINNLNNNLGSSIVTDSLNNVEYLRFDTAGLRGSLATVQNLMSDSSSSLFGFHIASASENAAFMQAAFGLSFNPAIANDVKNTDTSGFLSVMGDGYIWNSNNIWLHENGVVGNNNSLAFSFTSDFESVSNNIWMNNWSGNNNNWVGGMSFLAVRNTSVPEPSTLAIFALGMISLASRRFKKQS